MMLSLLIQYLLFSIGLAATSSPVWLTHTNIKCGSRTLVSTSTSSNGTFLSTFPSPFAGSSITCLSGIVDVQQNASGLKYFGLMVSGDESGTSGCQFTLALYDGTTVKSVKAAYFCYDTNIVTFLSSASVDDSYGWFTDMYTETGDRKSAKIINFSTGEIDLSHKVYIMPFLSAWRLIRDSTGYWTIKVTLEIINSTSYNRVYAITGDAYVSYIRSYRITYDQTAVQSTQKTYLDALFKTGTNNVQSSYTLYWSDTSNYFAGINHFNFSSTQLPKFSFSLTAWTITSPNYVFLNISTINYRYRSCVSPTLYYLESGNICYDVCPLGYFVNAADNYCQACYRGCIYCTSSASTSCTSCDPTSNRTLSGTSCPCITSYYDNGTVQCQPCSVSCQTCSGTASNCSTCPANSFRTQSGTTCPCNTGYFEMNAIACASCNDLMAGCQACTTTTVCTSCNTSMYMVLNSSNLCSCASGNQRTLTSGICKCNSGYADVGVALCATCSSQMPGCLTCSSKTVCLTCNTAGNWALSGNVCACNSGYANSSSSCVTCSSVITGCLTCSSTTACLTCDTAQNRALSSGTCPCATGFVLSGGNCVTCSSLMTGCTACSSSSVCTACDASLFRTLSSGSCVCQTGYTLSGGVCITCSSLMVACTACSSTSTCTTCDSSLFRTLSSGACVCQSGYILDNSACSSCGSFINGCTACNSISTCTACNTADHFVLSGTVCDCEPGYMNNSGVCATCAGIMYGCLTCTSPTQCTGCDSSLFTQLTGSNCSCISGYAYNNTQCLTCGALMEGCTACVIATQCTACGTTGFILQGTNCVACGTLMPGCLDCPTSDTCALCNDTGQFALSGTTCACNAGFVLAGSQCLTCGSAIPNCLTCTSAVMCTSCESGYFVDPITRLCLTCASAMPGCLTCSSSMACTSCDSAAQFGLSGSVCTCNAGYVLLGTECVTCGSAMPNCETCSSATICTSCSSSYFVNATTSQCSTCLNAMPGCLTCTSSSACTDCDIASQFTLSGTTCVCSTGYTLSGTQCVTCGSVLTHCLTCSNSLMCTSCSSGYYVDPITRLCSTCLSAMPGCLECSSNSTCTSCDSAAQFGLSGTTCMCNAGYVLSGSQCVTCGSAMPNCLTCTSAVMCSSCSSGYFVDPMTRLCLTCGSAMPGCLTCTSSTVCTSCDIASEFALSGTSCVCNAGFVVSGNNCVTCGSAMSNCQTCSSSTVCSSCSAGYFVNPTSLCSTCSSAIPGCLSCTSSSTCTTCDVASQFSLSGTTCVCNSGYILSGSSCLTCGTVINNCLTCTSPTYCTSCSNSYFANPTTHLCSTCSSAMPGCLVCTSNTVCTSCDTSIEFALSGSQCVCNAGFVLLHNECLTCPGVIENCTTCTSATVCTGCSQGSFVTSSHQCATCISVMPGCLNCSSGTNCLSCDTNLNMHLSGTNCVCDSGYVFIPATQNCDTCANAMTNCLTCSSGTVCTSCAAGYAVDSGFQCAVCSSFITGCTACTSNTTCTACDTAQQFTLQDSKCACPAGQFANSTGQICSSCTVLPNCTACINETYCTSCNAPFFALNGICRCPNTNQYFNITTQACENCKANCSTCTNDSACETCSNSDNRVLNDSDCVCKLNYYPTNTSTACIITGTCVTGYWFTNGICQEICGDGLLFQYQCDDGNTESGDGCSSSCRIQVNFTCKDGSTTSASKCSYNQPIEMQLATSKKDIYANAITFSIKVHPPLKVLDKFDFSSIVNSSLPSKSIQANYKDGVVSIKIVYTQSIQNVSASISLNPPTSMDNTFDMKVSSTTFTVDPVNTQAYYFSQEAYQANTASSILIKICTGLGITLLILGMGFWKMIGIETMNILQFLFFSMTFFTYLQPLLAPITQMYSSVNGYNDFFIDNPQHNAQFNSPMMPKIMTQMNIRARFLQNYNYMFICQMFLLIAGGFLFLMGNILREQQVYFLGFARYVFNELQLMLVMFNAMNIGVSLGIHCLYYSRPEEQSTGINAASLTVASISLAIMVMGWYLMIRHNEYFDHNNRIFKKSIFARLHPIILTAYRLVIGLIIGAASEFRFNGWVVLVLQACYLSYICIKRPYKKALITVRAIVNQSVVCIIILLPQIYEFYHSKGMIEQQELGTFMNIPFWAELGLVTAAILLNVACMVFSIYKTLCKKKTSQIHPPIEEQAESVKQSKDLDQPLSEKKTPLLMSEDQIPEGPVKMDDSTVEINLDKTQNMGKTRKRKIKGSRSNVRTLNVKPDSDGLVDIPVDIPAESIDSPAQVPIQSGRENPAQSLIINP